MHFIYAKREDTEEILQSQWSVAADASSGGVSIGTSQVLISICRLALSRWMSGPHTESPVRHCRRWEAEQA